MNPRSPDTLEVHVSFEVNRLAPTYLRDAYALLVPTVSVHESAAPESTPSLEIPTPAPEEIVG